MVPPVATRRTRGASGLAAGAGACGAAAGVCGARPRAGADRTASASVKRAAAAMPAARIAPLYRRGTACAVEREPAAQVARGLVGRLAVERHRGTRAARDARDLRPPLFADRRHFDAVFT